MRNTRILWCVLFFQNFSERCVCILWLAKFLRRNLLNLKYLQKDVQITEYTKSLPGKKSGRLFFHLAILSTKLEEKCGLFFKADFVSWERITMNLWTCGQLVSSRISCKLSASNISKCCLMDTL